MSLQLYLEDRVTYSEIDFVIKAFHDGENHGYKIKAFFTSGDEANNFSYFVNYQTNSDLLAHTGDNAVAQLMEHAKDDIKAGFYFKH